MDFPDYILKNYIDFDADYGPELWASEPDDSPRTTNGAENFYMHFNSQLYTPTLTFTKSFKYSWKFKSTLI